MLATEERKNFELICENFLFGLYLVTSHLLMKTCSTSASVVKNKHLGETCNALNCEKTIVSTVEVFELLMLCRHYE